MIDRATVEKILDATEIVDVISDFVTLKRRGANYIACCPFHNEKTPSFSVSPSKGIFKCFGVLGLPEQGHLQVLRVRQGRQRRDLRHGARADDLP